MSQCTDSLCQGGLECCVYDGELQASYCLTETYCNPNSATVGSLVILIFLLVATFGIVLALYCRWKALAPQALTLVNFVERQIRLEPLDKGDRTRLKSLASFD